ncbi:hypothetical protein F5Y17DRAFT_330845 [Xylariaceae sp. FL0594]|nr:hypothetical protein F5Y17DRAFT_330845 [Xylariaceae sp. FL0594]
MATTITTSIPTLLAGYRSLENGSERGLANEEREKKEEVVEKHHVSTVINYYRDPGDGSPPEPVRISDNTVKNKRPSIPVPTLVYDVTGEEDRFTLDGNGFQFVSLSSKSRKGDGEVRVRRRSEARQGEEGVDLNFDFHDPELVQERYYPVVERLLKDATGSSRVLIFDHKTRVGPSNWHALGEGNRAARGPLFRAHVDQSYDGAGIVLRRHLGGGDDEEGRDENGRARWQIVNVWRPLKTITRDPLAVADAHSIPETDLVAASILYRDGSRDETWTILPPSSAPTTDLNSGSSGSGSGSDRGGGHRWYYKHAQKPDEVLLIKCFDSFSCIPSASITTNRRIIARRAPHSAFVDPAYEDIDGNGNGNGKGNGPRESIEVRALVFYD